MDSNKRTIGILFADFTFVRKQPSFNQIRMQIKHLFYLLPFCFAKPQTSGDDGTSAIDAITDFASLFGGLQGDATSTMITEGLKFVSMELLPAIEAIRH